MAIAFEEKRGLPTRTVSEESEFVQIVRNESLKRNIDYIRMNLKDAEEYKARGLSDKAKECEIKAAVKKAALPGFIFQCSSFDEHEWQDKKTKEKHYGAYRHQEYGQMNGLFMVDFDHIEDPRGLWATLMEKGIEDEWSPFFAFVTSSDHGLKIVMPAKLECGNLASNQNAFMRWAGVEADKKTKDASRLSFAPSFDDILLFNEKLLSYENKDYIEKYNGKYRDGSSDADLFADSDFAQPAAAGAEGSTKTVAEGGAGSGDAAAGGSNPETAPWESRLAEELRLVRAGAELPVDETKERITYRGIPIREIINAYFGGTPPVEGTRHEELLAIASDLRYVLEFILDNCVYYLLRIPFVQDLAKEGDNVERDIADAFAYKRNRYLPKRVSKALALCQEEMPKTSDKENADDVEIKFNAFGEKLLNLSSHFPLLPQLFEEVRTPSIPAILFASAAFYGTLATRCWYYFYHNPEKMRRLNYAVFIIADPANGKSSIGDLYDTIMEPIKSDDAVQNKAINDYKSKIKEHQTKSDKNKKEGIAAPTPKTRIHGSRTANNVFIEDMVNNVEEVDGKRLNLHLFTFDAELDSADLANKGGQWIDKSIFELKAFHNEEDNQQYRNVDSVSGPFNVYWNFVYTGTPYSLGKKVTKRNFGSGLSTRLAVIPLCSPKYTMMPLRRKSKKNLARIDTLNGWAYKMHQSHGELPLWPLVEHTWRWVNDMMTIAGETNDETMNLFIRRVPYYGINVSAPFILMRHFEEFMEKGTFTVDEYDKELCSLVMEIQYYTQRYYFSKFATIYFENKATEAEENFQRKHIILSYLAKMPDVFTKEDLCSSQGLNQNYAQVVITRWERNNLVTSKGRGKKRLIEKTKYGKSL